MMDLSILIPARREEWLGRTIDDVLAHAEADTEVIAVLDGDWPTEPLAQHPRVTIIRTPSAIGQRAAVNVAARISRARYVMKLDAHCGVAQGFDRALIAAAEELGPTVTQVPTQYNLHIWDWVCQCGLRTYQGPRPGKCVKCGRDEYTRDVLWRRRESRKTTAWRFDSTMHFYYWTDYGRTRQHGDLPETMSCLGACWFLSRDRYWELDGMDEGHGSWGNMGTEVACKAWLSGGRLVTNKRTWFSHLFRTQPGFGFPYPMNGSDQERAREYSRRLWIQNQWPKQVRPLSWIIQHFAPVPDWTPPRTAGIVYYTDNRLEPTIEKAAQQQLEKSADGLPIVSVSLKPLTFGRNLVHDGERGYLSMFKQILIGLEALDTDDAFLCEHDVLYSPQHFWFRSPSQDTYYYDLSVWKVDVETGRAVTYETKQTSGLCADRKLLIEHYRKRIARVEAEGFSRRMGFEPGSHNRPERVDDIPSATWRSTTPNLDLRHGTNLTPSRWTPEQFRSRKNCQGWHEDTAVPYWGPTAGRMAALLEGLAHG